MASIALPGLQTGIDTEAIVQQLVAAAGIGLTRLETRQARWQEKHDAFGTLETRLETLQTTLDDLRHRADLQAYTAASNDTERLTVEAGASASEGAHDVTINQLAAAERQVHDGVADLDTLVGEGVFAYTYNGETRTVQTTDETTLEDLRDLINNDAGNPGATASILEYDAGGDQVYHLVLSGNDTGAEYTISIDDGQTTLDGTGGTVDFRAATHTETQSAQDAQVRVDGYPASDWITRSTNSIDDILPGVTLYLHAPTEVGETVRVSLTRDTECLKETVTDFVAAYNHVADYIQDQTAYDTASATAGILMGEYTVTHVLRTIRLPLIEAAPGFLDAADGFTLAGQVGLSLDRYGTLEFDEDTFDEAVGDDYLALIDLFGAERTGASDSDHLSFYAASTLTDPGTYEVRAVFDAGTLVSAQIREAGEGDDAWRDAEVDGNLITGDTDYPEAAIQITASYAGTGTLEAQVRVRLGVAGTLYEAIDDLLDPTDGPLTTAQQRCQTSIDSVADNIERQENRLDQTEARLRAQYARLEQTLAMLQAQSSALAAYGF